MCTISSSGKIYLKHPAVHSHSPLANFPSIPRVSGTERAVGSPLQDPRGLYRRRPKVVSRDRARLNLSIERRGVRLVIHGRRLVDCQIFDNYHKSASLANPNSPTSNQEPRTKTKNQEPRTKNQEPRTKNQEPRTKNQEPRTKNQEPRTKNQEPRTKNQEPRTKNQEPRTKNQEPRTENREPRTENRAPRLPTCPLAHSLLCKTSLSLLAKGERTPYN